MHSANMRSRNDLHFMDEYWCILFVLANGHAVHGRASTIAVIVRHVCTLHSPQHSDTSIAFAIKIFRIIQSLRFIVCFFFFAFWLDMHVVRLWLPHRFHCIVASTYSIFSIMWLFQYVLPEQAVKATSHSSQPWRIARRARTIDKQKNSDIQ